MNFYVPIIQLKPLPNLLLFTRVPHFPHGPLDYTERNSRYHNTIPEALVTKDHNEPGAREGE